MSETAGDSQSGRKSRGIKVQSDLFCKSGCGFYGNSNWQGFCSKCWKEKLVKQNHENAHHSLQHHSDSHQVKSAKGYFSRGSEERSTFPRRLRTRTAEEPAKLPGNQSPSKTATFSRFEEKRIQHHDKRTRTVKSLFKKNSVPAAKDFSSVPYLEDMLEGASSATASLAAVFQGLPSAGSSSGSNTSSDAFTEFLKTLSKPVAVDISRHIASFTQRMLGMCEEGASIDELSDTAKEFYQNLSDRLRNHPTFGDATTEQLEAMMDFTEKTLMTKLYKSVFFALSAHNEDRDLAIQKRIRSLNWVSASHLDCCIDESRPEVRELIDQAITYAIEIDSRRAPQDKLSCIVKCSKKIFELLRVSRGFSGQTEAASADEFLPALIFVVLRANPPLLHSNISYIDKFCNPGRLLSGEAGYYFTNLCCAVEFIEKLDHDSLNLTKDEFDRFMSGEALPPSVAYAFGAFGSAGGGVDAIDTPWLCEGVRIMKGNLVALGQLSERDRKLREENEKLLRDGREFVEKIKKEVDEVLKRTPLSSQPHKSPAKLDESSEEQNLPPPMIPEVVGCISPIPAQETSTASGVANVTDFLEELELGQEVSEDCDDQILDLTVPENHIEEEEKAGEKAVALEEPKFVDALDCVEEKVIEEKKEETPKPKPRRPMPEYTGFSRQGESIPTIPCDTGSVHSSPVRSSASPTGGERVVSVLSGILRIADAF